ncbi:MAG: type I secretion system permease/ATPase [Pseudomonadota bacterium]
MASTLETPLQSAMRSGRRAFIFIGFFSFFLNLLMLVSPFYMLQIYDRVLSSNSKDTLFFLTLLAVGLLAIGAVLELVRSRILVRLGEAIDDDVNAAVYDAIFRRRQQSGAGGGQPVRDLETFRQFMSSAGLVAFFDAPWTPIFIAVIFLFHPWLGVIALVGAILLFAVALTSEFATRDRMRRAAGASMTAHSMVESNLRNCEVAHAMGMTDALRARWMSQHLRGLENQTVASDRSGLLTAIAKLIRPVLQIGILGTGAYLVIEQQITAGVMIAASIILGRALAPVEASIAHWRAFIAARASYERIREILTAHPAPEERMPLPAPSGALSVEGVTLLPPGGDKPILLAVNFSVAPGEMVGVTGPSGAGKSALARLITGVWPPKVGVVRLDNASLSDWDDQALGPHIGYLPQDVELFSGTVAENIARFQQVSSESILDAARLAGAHEMILRLEQGYDTQIGEGGVALSGGQRQRIGLARAVYGLPALIVLDEPNANLDTAGEQALSEALLRLRELKRTVVLIAHRNSGLPPVDQILTVEGKQVRTYSSKDQNAAAANPAAATGGGTVTPIVKF